MMYNTVESVYPDNNTSMMTRQHSSHNNTFSSQSVLRTVDKFVASVNAMNETVMVPCRLLDMDINTNSKQVPELLRNSRDPYSVYSILNATKNDLMYGPSTEDDDDDPACHDTTSERWSSPCESSSSETNSVFNGSSNNSHHKAYNGNNNNGKNSSKSTPVRRQSTLSMLSVASTTSDCSTESEGSSASDCIEEEQSTEELPSPPENVAEASTQLRTHLLGLQECLSKLSDTANFITVRYQEELSK